MTETIEGILIFIVCIAVISYESITNFFCSIGSMFSYLKCGFFELFRKKPEKFGWSCTICKHEYITEGRRSHECPSCGAQWNISE